MSDLISRKAILKHIEKIRYGLQMMDDTHRASIVMNGMHLCEEAVRNQQSAQPDDRLEKIADLVEGTIDHFDRDDAMDLLYQIKEVFK